MRTSVLQEISSMKLVKALKMKLLLSFIVVLGLFLSAEAGYGDILDEYDWIGVAKDEKGFPRVIECLQQEVPCDNLQKLKEYGIQVFKTNCSDCTPAQKQKFEDYKTYIVDAHPKEYEIILKLVKEAP